MRALTPGSSEITATYGSITASTTVTVVARTLQSLTVLTVTSPARFIPGTEKQFKAEALYTDGTRQDVTADALWIIESLNVATFSDQNSDPGLIVAVDAGTTTLRAKFGGKDDSETLVVSQ